MPNHAITPTPNPGPGALAGHLRRLRHDLRTPITGILGYAELIHEECPLELRRELGGVVDRLVNAARHLAAAVDEGCMVVEARADAHALPPLIVVRLVGRVLAPHLALVMQEAESLSTRLESRHPGIQEDLGRVLAESRILNGMILVQDPSPVVSEDSLATQVLGESAPSHDLPGTILVVDDSPAGQDMLGRRLGRAGHRVVVVERAKAALARLREGGIDLVLSDVLLPGETGLDLCRWIRSDAQFTAIPVILVTALHERADRLAGIEAGANDFLSKPIDGPDLQLRVRNALRGKRHNDEILAANQRQQELETMRDHLTHLIVHDLRQPLAGLCGYLELFLARSEDGVDPKLRELVSRAERQGQQLARLVNQVLDVAKIEAGRLTLEPTRADLVDTASQAVATLGPGELSPVVLDTPGPLPWLCDHALVGRVIINLVGNALRFTPPGKRIHVRILAGEEARIEVKDEGPGIDPAYHQRIFEKFGQVVARRQQQGVTSGLGLFFCKLAVELHGGRIGVDSILGRGSRFWFTLPPRPPGTTSWKAGPASR